VDDEAGVLRGIGDGERFEVAVGSCVKVGTGVGERQRRWNGL